MSGEVTARATELFEQHRERIFRRTDRMFAGLMVAQWACAIVIALVVSPHAWKGVERSTHIHVWAALLLGGAISSLPIALAILRPGASVTRHVVAVAQMLWSGLFIHLCGGRIETHFHVFGSLAFLAFYRDWRVLPTAGLVVTLDHLLRGSLWPESVYGVTAADAWRTVEHFLWVVFIEVFLIVASVQATREMRQIAQRHAQVEALSTAHTRAGVELRRLNAELERRVEERTGDLERANADLSASVSQLEQANGKLVLADRLVSLGQLSAGIAHEINNPLAYVVANLEFVRERLAEQQEPDTALGEALADAAHGAERVSKIVADLKMFARLDEERRERVDMHAVIEDACRMAMREIRHRARLVRDEHPVPSVLGDSVRLGQVFLNLLINAAQACTAPREGGHEVRISTRVDAAGQVVVEIADTGDGIAPDVLARMFDPFFTTKPVGVGTGLGLSICHGIVASLGGEIAVHSELGGGSRFRVVLPGVEPCSERVVPGVAAAAFGERRRILVVDDEPKILSALQRALADAHDVEVTTSAREAVRKVKEGARYDAILCDLMMPEMSGMELHRVLSNVAPGQSSRMIFISGGAVTSESRDFVAQQTAPCVEKPFRAASVSALVADFCRDRAA